MSEQSVWDEPDNLPWFDRGDSFCVDRRPVEIGPRLKLGFQLTRKPVFRVQAKSEPR